MNRHFLPFSVCTNLQTASELSIAHRSTAHSTSLSLSLSIGKHFCAGASADKVCCAIFGYRNRSTLVLVWSIHFGSVRFIRILKMRVCRVGVKMVFVPLTDRNNVFTVCRKKSRRLQNDFDGWIKCFACWQCSHIHPFIRIFIGLMWIPLPIPGGQTFHNNSPETEKKKWKLHFQRIRRHEYLLKPELWILIFNNGGWNGNGCH